MTGAEETNDRVVDHPIHGAIVVHEVLRPPLPPQKKKMGETSARSERVSVDIRRPRLVHAPEEEGLVYVPVDLVLVHARDEDLAPDLLLADILIMIDE